MTNDKKGIHMIHDLLPIYRKEEIYTIFYDEDEDTFYTLGHRKKSFGGMYSAIIGTYLFAWLLDVLYVGQAHVMYDVVIAVICIIITYHVTKKFYNNYYLHETKRETILYEQTIPSYARKV